MVWKTINLVLNAWSLSSFSHSSHSEFIYDPFGNIKAYDAFSLQMRVNDYLNSFKDYLTLVLLLAINKSIKSICINVWKWCSIK